MYSSNTNGPQYDLGVMATYSCAVGYSLENGDKDRLCQHDGVSESGEWSGSAPVCVGECFSFIINIAHNVFSSKLSIPSSRHFLLLQEPVLH